MGKRELGGGLGMWVSVLTEMYRGGKLGFGVMMRCLGNLLWKDADLGSVSHAMGLLRLSIPEETEILIVRWVRA